jgi:hypothetical protein
VFFLEFLQDKRQLIRVDDDPQVFGGCQSNHFAACSRQSSGGNASKQSAVVDWADLTIEDEGTDAFE